MFDNMESLMKLMGLDMTRGLKATLYMTNIDNSGVVLKVWLEECNYTVFIIIIIINLFIMVLEVRLEECNYIVFINIIMFFKVWLEECNWKEYPALTVTQVE